MAPILKSADLNPDELRHLIGGLRPPAADRLRAWIEAPDGWALAYWPGLAEKLPWCGAGHTPLSVEAEQVLERSQTGRLFAPSGELRWRVLPVLGEACCRTIFLGNKDWIPGYLDPRQEIERLGLWCRHVWHPLWGQQTRRTPGEWIELRIPHRFRYPVEAPEPGRGRVGVQVEVEVWSDGCGEPHFVRLRDLRAKED